MAARATTDECQRCGACCFSHSSEYVPVTATDHARLGARAETLLHRVRGADYMRMLGGRCVALTVDDGAFRCTIYAQRPEVCRELMRGTPPCHEERAAKRTTALTVLTAPAARRE